MALTTKRALWYAAESSFSTDPSADGSGYAFVHTVEIGDLSDDTETIETAYGVATGLPTAPVAGRQGWGFDFSVPAIGLATAAGDGASPPAADWLDNLLTHAFGASATVPGEGCTNASTATTLAVDTDAYGLQDLVPVYEASVPAAAARSQWVLIGGDAGTGTYDPIYPSWDQTPSTAAIAYGARRFTFAIPVTTTGAFVYRQDDVDFTLLGGRIANVTISAELGKMVQIKFSVRGDRIVQESKGSLPAVSVLAVTPLKSLLSPVWWAGSKIATKSIEIDLGMDGDELGATSGTHGRAGMETRFAQPSIKIEPLYADALRTAKRDATTGRVLVQLGGGVLSGSYLGTMALHLEEAFIDAAGPSEDSRRQRQSVTFKASHKVFFSGSTAARYVQLARA